MRRLLVRNHGLKAGILEELEKGYGFTYFQDEPGGPISLTMPFRSEAYHFEDFPPFFEGLLPEGFQLSSLLLSQKLDADDYMGQLLAVGQDCVGSVTVHEL